MKKQLKRIICFCITAVIGISVTFPVQAAAVPVSLSPSSYVLSLLLNSMGLDVSLSALSSWVGSTETYQDYVAAGEKGTLSAWEQWCYDQSKAEGGQALKDSYEANIEWLGKLSWGDTVETIPAEKLHSAAKSLNDWVRTFPSYGTDNTYYGKMPLVGDGYISVLDPGVIDFFGFEFETVPDSAYIIPIYFGVNNGISYYIVSEKSLKGTYYDKFYKETKEIRTIGRRPFQILCKLKKLIQDMSLVTKGQSRFFGPCPFSVL